MLTFNLNLDIDTGKWNKSVFYMSSISLNSDINIHSCS